MEPVGPCHRIVVDHGNHVRGNRLKRFPPHQPNHHTHHESPKDNTRHAYIRAVRHKYTETRAVWLMSPCHVSVLKLLKMATGMRALLDTVIQALPQVTHGPKAAEYKSCLWMLALCQLTRFHFLPDSPSGLFNPNKQHHLNTKSWKLSARLLIRHCIHIFKACFNCFATGYLWR